MEDLHFTSDLTEAAIPGNRNRSAIRITNPVAAMTGATAAPSAAAS